MKKIIYFVAAMMMLTFTSCGDKQKTETVVEETQVVDVEKAVYLEDILNAADSLVGKEVVIRGIVDHTCSHSGRRCFIVSKEGSMTIRVEAKGNIGGFNRELAGTEIAVKGTLREKFISQEEIDAMEEQLKQKQEETKEGDHCDSEMKAIASMRQWMKDKNKESYSEYYIDGTDFESID